MVVLASVGVNFFDKGRGGDDDDDILVALFLVVEEAADSFLAVGDFLRH